MTENAAEMHGNNIIEVSGTDLDFRSVPMRSDSPAGGQIAKAAGFTSDDKPFIYQWRTDGGLEEIRSTEEADLADGRRFLVVLSDRAYRFTIDSDEYDWPARMIKGSILRKLGRVPADKEIVHERSENPDHPIGEDDIVDLGHEGVEAFKTRKPTWRLSVQGVVIVSDTPEIGVADALTRAGFNAAQPWIIILKVKGEPKRQLAITGTVDLRTPGIEKIRLIPKEVNNGEARSALRRDFALLDVDENHLDAIGAVWETVAAGRWLIIHEYAVPSGYNVSKITLALMIPPLYPQAQIDMFFANPPLQLASGGKIPATEERINVRGVPFQQWSRHRGGASPWNSACDNVITHLALVESSIAEEVGQ